MKRQSFRRRSGILTPGRLLTGSIGLFILFVVLVLRFAFPGALTAIATPFWSVGEAGSAAVGNSTTVLASKQQIENQLAAVQAQNATLTAENLVLAEKAASLTALLGTTTDRGTGVVANVLVRPPVSPYDTLVVDAGSADNIVTGATAYGPGGIPVGRVGDLTPHSARIVLYSSPGVDTPGWAGVARVPVTLHGTSAGSISAEVPTDATIAIGDSVLVSGALPIGSIVRIDRDPSSPTMTLRVRLVTNPFSLVAVTILPKAASL